MTLGDLTRTEVRRRLTIEGVRLGVGPFVFSLKTTLRGLAEQLQFLYSAFPVSAPAFADYHVRVDAVRSVVGRVLSRAEITVDGEADCPFNPFPVRMALPCLEWALNWCIYRQAHQYLILHAAVLERGGNAVLIVGPAGSGKSTLCAALALRGWRLLSDELALLRPAELTLAALSRPVILKNESIRVIAGFSGDAEFGPAVSGSRKGIVAHMKPPRESVARAGETAVPAWIVFVGFQPGLGVEVESVSRARSHYRIAESSFNYGLWGQIGFETLARLVESCHCFEVRYGDLHKVVDFFNQSEFLEGCPASDETARGTSLSPCR